jgi:hypothetical protein
MAGFLACGPWVVSIRASEGVVADVISVPFDGGPNILERCDIDRYPVHACFRIAPTAPKPVPFLQRIDVARRIRHLADLDVGLEDCRDGRAPLCMS